MSDSGFVKSLINLNCGYVFISPLYLTKFLNFRFSDILEEFLNSDDLYLPQIYPNNFKPPPHPKSPLYNPE